MVLIINNQYAVWKHMAGFKALDATAQLSFENLDHAIYFIDHFNGQSDYKEAMPINEVVEFSVYHEGLNGLFADKMIKPLNWKR